MLNTVNDIFEISGDSSQCFSSDFVEDENKQQDVKKLTFSEELFKFMILFSVSHRAMAHLIALLNKFNFEGTPRDLYSLLKGLQKISCKYKGLNEELCYISLKDNFEFLAEKKLIKKTGAIDVDLQFNVDGMPVYINSKLCVWPLLVKISSSSISYVKPLPLALFAGLSKPDLKPLIRKLTDEVQCFKRGINILSNFFIKVINVTFVCDAPARAQIMEVKYHSGYSSCHICRIKGVYLDHSVVFPHRENIIYRTDDMYRSFNENNQVGLSPLIEVCSFVKSFPPEYMHSVLLGTTKRLIPFFVCSKKSQRFPCKIKQSLLNEVNSTMKNIRTSIPNDFQRKLRPLNYYELYKATEFRQILLYLGPFIFKKYLPKPYYDNFTTLHFAMYCLCSSHCHDLLEVAKYCIDDFLKTYETLYGVKNQTYNNHCLLHLPEFIAQHGKLDNFSSFPFENYLN